MNIEQIKNQGAKGNLKRAINERFGRIQDFAKQGIQPNNNHSGYTHDILKLVAEIEELNQEFSKII